ncbi:MAG: hypothetical protein HYY16_08825 [Planctomycetes bacterium]|nr:hypothetical protein [Planctomycetota bacterium]
MKQGWVCLAILGSAWAAGCGPLHERGEAWQQYYASPAGETTSEVVERKKIIHWAANVGERKCLGILEKGRIRLKGSREWHETYAILNPAGTARIGFVNETGAFFRYDREGERVRVGEYPIFTTGLKVFFGLPLAENLALEDFDLYEE